MASEGPGRRGPGAVAASILAALLIGAYLAASPGWAGDLTAEFAVNVAVLVLVFWFPAMRFRSAGEVLAAWRPLLPWLLAWTLVWDLATSGIVGERELLEEWWLVYPTGVLTLYALLLFHGFIVERVGAARPEG